MTGIDQVLLFIRMLLLSHHVIPHIELHLKLFGSIVLAFLYNKVSLLDDSV